MINSFALVSCMQDLHTCASMPSSRRETALTEAVSLHVPTQLASIQSVFLVAKWMLLLRSPLESSVPFALTSKSDHFGAHHRSSSRLCSCLWIFWEVYSPAVGNITLQSYRFKTTYWLFQGHTLTSLCLIHSMRKNNEL